MLNNILECPEAQDTGSIILTGFEPNIVLSSLRTVIEEYQQCVEDIRFTPADYNITNTS